MKKVLVLLFTVALVISCSAIIASANESIEESNGVFVPYESIEDSEPVKITDDLVDHPESEEIITIGPIGTEESNESADAEAEGSVDQEDSVVSADVEAEDDDMDVEIKFSTDRISTSLKHMGIGLAGVMMVLALIGIVVFVLNKVFKNK